MKITGKGKGGKAHNLATAAMKGQDSCLHPVRSKHKVKYEPVCSKVLVSECQQSSLA